MATNKEWRYVYFSEEQIDNINNYNPEDELIDMIDNGKVELEEPSFSFHSLIEANDKRLTKKQKVVLYKRIVEGKTFAQIGKECNSSRQNCFEIFNKAITRLRDDLSWMNNDDE